MLAILSSLPLPNSWHELYLMLGTSSAALIGLLFVATSLHLAEIANEEIYRLRAQYTTLILLSTLLQATAVLYPADAASRRRTFRNQPLGSLVSNHTPFESGQNPGRTRSRRLLGSPSGDFHRGIPRWNCRRRDRRRRSRVGDVWRDCVLYDFADHLDMERMDDHAGHWAIRKIPENESHAMSALGH